MIGKKMQTALNKQVNEELYSAYLYLSMSTDFQEKNLPGFASWMEMQAQEELAHAMQIYRHIQERGGRVLLDAIKKPPTEWKTSLEAFQAAYDHECYITGKIHDLVTLAHTEKDYAAANMLQWFVDEQVEEESSVDEVVQKLNFVGEDGRSMYILDKEMAERQPSAATNEVK